ncbi:MAG: hypothetical protein QOK48_1385 [Blastocatellia bacterium]|nr:hypothetical protein [Blastocatellia bacterium]
MRSKTIPQRMIRCAAGLAWLILAVASLPAQQPPETGSSAAAPPVGAITGRVLNSAGEPLVGATVYISSLGQPQGRSTAVDASGNFRVDGLEAAAYSVWASAPGFVYEAPVTPTDVRRYHHLGDSVSLTMTKGGVISGIVTSSTNAPIVNTTVRAFRVRSENGEPLTGITQTRVERFTDDRGYYRLYGLEPGFYVISAGGSGRFFGFMANQYESDVPTYAPSSTRETATEIFVGGGDEATADIQYRGEAGHSVSGALPGIPPNQGTMFYGITISLTDTRSRSTVMAATASAQNNYGFAFYGVSDGEYEVFAQRPSPSGETSVSEPRHIKVAGADLTGINMNLFPLAAISGRLVLESVPRAECIRRRSTALQETVIGARRITQETKTPRTTAKTQGVTNEVPLNQSYTNAESTVNAKGEFTLRNLQGGSYRFVAELPEPGWYIRAVSMGTPPAVPKPSDPNIPRDGLTVKFGDRVSGLSITFAEGAAFFRGRISAAEGQRVPAGLRVYLVPVERESAENVLRFFEATADSTAGFAIEHIAPGRYWLIARPADEGDPTKVKPIRQDSALRARVLREAEALKKEITFKPCEQASDYVLPWVAVTRQ